jgi:hypothetical protein
MGKTLFKLVVVLVVLLLAGRWLLQWDIKNSIDTAINSVSGAVHINYDRLEVGLDGKVVVKRITLNGPDESLFSAYIQRVEVDMQSLPELIQRRLGGQLPDKLRISVKGVTANLGNLAELSESAVDCMDPAHQPADWMLGLDQDSNWVIDYSYTPANRELTANFDIDVPGAYALKTQLRLSDVSANFRRVGGLDMVRVAYQDVRGIEAWRTYCAQRHDLEVEAFLARHVAAMETYLNYRGLSMTDTARTAYQQFLTESGNLTARWVLGLKLQQSHSPEQLQALLVDRLELELAGTPVSPIFNKVTPKRRAARAPLQPKTVAPPPAPIAVTFDEARDYVGRTVSVVTGSKTTRGTLLSVGESELVLEVVNEGMNRFSITYYRSRLDEILVEP